MPVENSPAAMRAEDHSSMQTLAPASFAIVMAAINNAKQKGHSQVQPLHVAAALLDPHTRSIALHNACLQSLRDPSHPLKCDALDLCFKVALERLPMNNNPEKNNDQSMSNALAAALKRAHANERRGTPEQSLQPLLAVKTGTAHLTISILDDPSVSRVFHEAGFSSTDVKNNLEEAMAQAALAGPSTPPPPASDTTGLRRVQLTMSPYCAPHLDTMHFPNPFFPPPVAFAAVSSSKGPHGRMFERGRPLSVLELQPESSYVSNGCPQLKGADRPALAVSSGSTQFLDADIQQRRLKQVGMLGRPLDASSRFVAHGSDLEMRKIVEMLLRSPGKRNPVLLSEMGCSSVVRDLSQRLSRGEIAALRGVQFLNLPVTSLSAGMVGQETVERKMAKLRRDVDGYVLRDGAIVSIGDLQWLLEPSQSMSSVVLRDLHHLMSSNVNNRLWLLASASPIAYERFQAASHPSLERLGLCPIQLLVDDADALIQPRASNHQRIGQNDEIAFLRETAPNLAAKSGAVENGLEASDICAECTRNFQQECAVLGKDDQTLSLQTGRAPVSSFGNGSSWLRGQKDRRWTLQLVKNEDNVATRGMEELRQKWLLKCSAHQPQPKNFLGGNPGTLLTSCSSPEATNAPQKGNPQLEHPLLSRPAMLKRMSHPLRPLSSKSEDYTPLHARLATRRVPNLLSVMKPPAIGGADEVNPVTFRNEAANVGTGISQGLAVDRKSSSDSVYSGGCIVTDLALGRPAVQVSQGGIDLKGHGHHPLHLNQLQPPPSKAKPVKTPAVRPSDVEVLNRLCWSLGNLVPWQKEAVGAVASTVIKCRAGDGRKMGAYARTDAWLMFLGPDRVGKREVAKSLATVLFGSEEKFVLMTGWHSGSSTGILAADSKGVKYVGHTPLQRLAEAVVRTPCSVVLLENVDHAEYLVKKNLLAAMERGKLPDRSGREVSLANVVIIMTCDAGAGLLAPRSKESPIEFEEDNLSKVVPRDVRLFIENKKSEEILQTRASRLSVVNCARGADQEDRSPLDHSANSISIFGRTVFREKRSAPDGDENGANAPLAKVCKTEASMGSPGLSLDLNLSVQENLEEEKEPCTDEEGSESTGSENLGDLIARVIEMARGRFHKDMFSRLDAAVVFKPFDLNRLTEWVLEKIDCLVEVVMQSRGVPVEVDSKLLELMVSSAWQNFSNPDDLQGWIDNVLMRAVAGALDKAPLRPDSVVKLIGVERRRPTTPEFAHSGFLADDAKAELLPSLIHVCT